MDLPEKFEDEQFRERIAMLRNHGYRGFVITNIRKEWGDGVQVTARNDAGRSVTAGADTNDDAYQKIIDDIDLLLDESL